MEGLPVSYSLNSGDNGNNWWGDFIGAVIRMEGKEFMTAIEKAESVEHFLKEATHTLAAVMLFCAEK